MLRVYRRVLRTRAKAAKWRWMLGEKPVRVLSRQDFLAFEWRLARACDRVDRIFICQPSG